MADSSAHPAKRTVDPNILLAETLVSFTNEAFPTHLWTQAAINRCFLTVQKFCDTVKVITSLDDVALRRKVLAHGVVLKFWETPVACTVGNMYKFCIWCRSPEGTTFINDLRRQRTLEKKVISGLTAEDVGLVSALDQQLADHARAVKEHRAKYDDYIMELRRKIVLAEQQKEEGLRQIAINMLPASDFKPLDDMELGERCYELYRDECMSVNKPEVDFNEQLMDDVRSTYGNQAMAVYKAEYLRDENRRVIMKMWVEDKILELSKVGEKRLANSFRTWLESAGGGLAPQVRAQAEAALIAAGLRRGPVPQLIIQEEPETGRLSPHPQSPQASDEGHETPDSPIPEGGNESTVADRVKRKRQAPRGGASNRGGRGRHTRGQK